MQQNRLERGRSREDTRQWVQDRRARTRLLIEHGGLVQKSGLVEMVEDDRATLLGALLDLTDRLQEDPDNLKARWRRRGLRQFEAGK